jgi:hypothetical protein
MVTLLPQENDPYTLVVFIFKLGSRITLITELKINYLKKTLGFQRIQAFFILCKISSALQEIAKQVK